MEEFVTFEQAKTLNELGFDWKCTYGYYLHSWMNEPKLALYHECEDVSESYDGTDCYPAPTLAQAQRWLREVKYIFLIVDVAYKETFDDDALYYWRTCDQMGWKIENSKDDDAYFDTYEQALSAGIDRALETLKEKQK